VPEDGAAEQAARSPGIAERTKMAEKNSCEFQGKIYPHESSVCIGDQCIQCNDGKWGPNQYELEEKKRNLEYTSASNT